MSSDSADDVPNLFERLTGGAGALTTSLHCWVGDGYRPAHRSEVVRDAAAMTAGLRAAGVRPGTPVAAVLTNGPWSVRGLLAVWLAGGAVASLPVPARGLDGQEYARQLRSICRQLGTPVFLVEERMLATIPDEVRDVVAVRSWESLADSGRIEPVPPADDEVAFIQYSSGSTSNPKGCMLTPRAIAHQLAMLADLTQARRGRDVAATWLPLSHDMGIFGCLLMTWWNDVEHYLSTPERFMFSPATWFRDMAEYGCDLTAGTNTALHLAARSASRLTGSTRPIRARVCIIGAERVEYDTLRLAVENLGPYGLTERALMPAYGLAEATLAVTGTPVDELPRHLSLDSIALADGELCEVSPTDPAATHVVSAGPACTGVELLTGPADGLAEITVRSPSLGVGYHHDPERTARHFTDGVLHTSDLGFVRDGRLFPIGRTDDVIAVAGRKVYAREIETSLDEIDGVRHGCSTLVAHHDGSRLRLTLFIEARNSRVDYRSLARSAASVAMAKAAVAIDECVFLPRNTLPKTPTGKIQRHRCRHLLQSGRLTPVATVRLA